MKGRTRALHERKGRLIGRKEHLEKINKEENERLRGQWTKDRVWWPGRRPARMKGEAEIENDSVSIRLFIPITTRSKAPLRESDFRGHSSSRGILSAPRTGKRWRCSLELLCISQIRMGSRCIGGRERRRGASLILGGGGETNLSRRGALGVTGGLGQ